MLDVGFVKLGGQDRNGTMISAWRHLYSQQLRFRNGMEMDWLQSYTGYSMNKKGTGWGENEL